MKAMTNENGVALDGYDVVAYFTEDRPVRGRSDFSATQDGATYYFQSREHLDLFTKQPDKYMPRFGGFCAFGVAAHKACVPSDPRTFKVYDGQLLLFFNDLHEGQPVNTKVLWNQDERSHYQQAASAWMDLK